MVLMLASCMRAELPRSGVSHGNRYSIYTVRPGDTLYSIGKRFGIDHHLLIRRNHLRYPYTIYVGQQLYLTRVAPRSESLPVVAQARTPTKVIPMSQISRPPAKASARNKVHRKQVRRQTSHKSVVHKSAAHQRAAAGGHIGKLAWPVHGRLSSAFGMRHGRMHDGIDILAKEGTPVRAAADGEVVYSDNRLAGYGKLIILRHSGDLFTAYAHNQRNLVRKGDLVHKGDIIARVGQTGRATAPHVHFEVRRGSTPVDPLAYLKR